MHIPQDAVEHFVGVAASFINIVARVTAHQPFDSNRKSKKVTGCVFCFNFQRSGGVYSAGTSYEYFTVVFGVQVDKYFSFQQIIVECKSAGQASFFVGSEKTFQRRVLQIVR